MLNRARRRERERQAQKKQSFHVKRVVAEVKIQAATRVQKPESQARVVLNDITPTTLVLFTSMPLLPGQEVAVTLEEPKQFYIQGSVSWCELYNINSHIISSNPFGYRSMIEFRFNTDEEREEVRAYCDELGIKWLNYPVKPAPEPEASATSEEEPQAA
jgi:hypothetical protein